MFVQINFPFFLSSQKNLLFLPKKTQQMEPKAKTKSWNFYFQYKQQNLE